MTEHAWVPQVPVPRGRRHLPRSRRDLLAPQDAVGSRVNASAVSTDSWLLRCCSPCWFTHCCWAWPSVARDLGFRDSASRGEIDGSRRPICASCSFRRMS